MGVGSQAGNKREIKKTRTVQEEEILMRKKIH